MTNKRLFIAAPLPPEYYSIIHQFKDQQADQYRWIAPENWHLTLLFLGDFPENHLNSLQTSLKAFFPDQSPVTLTPKSFIFAPHLKKARMIWLRFYENNAYDQLCAKLYQSLQEFYSEHSIPFTLELHERQIPHITLARFKPVNAYNRLSLKGRNLAEALPEFTIHQAKLFESTRTPEGAVYHLLETFTLNGPLS